MEHDDWTKTGTSVLFSSYYDSGTTSWEKHRNRAIAEGSRLQNTFEARLIRLSTYRHGCQSVIRIVGCKWAHRMAERADAEEAVGSKPGWGTASPTTTPCHDLDRRAPDPMEKRGKKTQGRFSTSLHGITNGGIVPIAAEIGQVFTASIHVKAGPEAAQNVGIGQDGNEYRTRSHL